MEKVSLSAGRIRRARQDPTGKRSEAFDGQLLASSLGRKHSRAPQETIFSLAGGGGGGDRQLDLIGLFPSLFSIIQ